MRQSNSSAYEPEDDQPDFRSPLHPQPLLE
jgi:hypothetical protein